MTTCSPDCVKLSLDVGCAWAVLNMRPLRVMPPSPTMLDTAVLVSASYSHGTAFILSKGYGPPIGMILVCSCVGIINGGLEHGMINGFLAPCVGIIKGSFLSTIATYSSSGCSSSWINPWSMSLCKVHIWGSSVVEPTLAR